MATILVVDDLPANRDVLVTLLRYQGHQLLEAADGNEGLAAVRAVRPDLVITDVLMPIMDGYEFVRQLRLDPATRQIPVVFYTAHYSEREARELALSSGVAHVLTKPAEPSSVMDVVNRILAGELESGLASINASLLAANFDREHLRLVTDKLSEKAGDLKEANARLRALINIGLELASERNSDRLLRTVATSARDLFGATYVTLGVVDRHDRTVREFVACGMDAGWIKSGDSVPGVLGTVVAERRAIRGHNSTGDAVALQLPSHHPEIRAFLAAPIVSPAHVYGWICLVGNEPERTFTEDDEQLVTALSGQIGRIYENGYFYSIAEKRAADLEHQVQQRRHVEVALREERNRAQSYLDTAEVILLSLDVAGRITLVNRYACSVLGWSADELIGRHWIETCVPARLRDSLRTGFVALLAGRLTVFENEVLTKSGEERLIEWRNTVIRDDSGRVVGTFSSGTDITERHRAVEALRTAEERMRFALQNADVGIWDMDYTTGVLEWSETIERHYGFKPHTFPGTFEAFIDRIHPEDRTPTLETIGKATQSGTDFQLLHRALWPDGTVRWLTGSGRVLLGKNGEPVRAVGISQDVTARHALEEQYQQAQKMEAIGRLAGGIAHDFNNLLTAILGYCELLLDGLDAADPRQPDITEIQRAGERAAGLTRQLLAFSRKQIIEPTLLDLNGLVTGMHGMLGRLIGEDVRIELGLGDNLAVVKADRGQIEQILMNLTVNARDAMPDGGTITIETANVELDEDYATAHFAVVPGPYVALIVTDTGTGMSLEIQKRLFEPFFTTKEPGKGTGLGLATIHGIVTRSGGNVNVYSEVDKGTSFKVYLPRAAAAGAEATLAPAQKSTARRHTSSKRRTVLVVEDADGLRKLTSRLLERQGYTVLVAANAGEAMRVFQSTPSIDLVLTDVVMPGGSGPDLVKQMTKRRPRLKVVYMSGYTEDTIVHREILAPGIAFLNKPFTSDTLGRKLLEVLDR